jgi:flavin-dependent dehydrogenase
VNDAITAPLLVGAAGHWCPVARRLNDPPSGAPLVAAQEFEVPLDAAQERACAVAADRPELYFSRDLGGYGWAVRKGRFLNVGFGRLHSHALPAAATAFLDFLKSTQRVPADLAGEWRGHAYLIDEPPHRRILDDGILLVGDAAGLAYPRSGEGIRPAVESGLAAAAAIVAAAGVYTRDRLAPYERRLHRGDGLGPVMRLLAGAASPRVMAALASYLIGTQWFARHVLLDRWFLHRQGPIAPQR